jgi:hypothetical protein
MAARQVALAFSLEDTARVDDFLFRFFHAHDFLFVFHDVCP